MSGELMSKPFPHAGKKTTAQPFEVLSSPAFAVEYPHIINPHLLDPGARAGMEESWKKGIFPERKLEIFHLKDVYLIDESLILDKDLRVIENAGDYHDDEEIERAIAVIRKDLEAMRLPHFVSGIVSKRRAAGNYGHFLLELLPLAVIGRRLSPAYDPVHIIHYAEAPLQDVMFRSFRLLGVSLSRVLVRDFGQPIHLADAIVVRGLSVHGTYMSPLAVQAVEEMAASVPAGPHKKIFVRRVPGWNRGRALLNQEQVCARMEDLGFVTIEPGEMTLEQQISVFRGADEVIGVSGAAMTNIVFCRPGTQVKMLVPARFPDTFFWFIATHKRLKFTELRAAQLPGEEPDPWKADFTLSEADIQYLEGAGSEAETLSRSKAEIKSPSEPDELIVHVQNVGDVGGRLGEWVGRRGSGLWIEGFRISPQRYIIPEEIEYQAVLGANWLTPGQAGGTFCGSRDWSLPLMGLCLRLRGAAADKYECFYSATFLDGTTRESVVSGEVCASPNLAPMEAFQIKLRPRPAT
jgi:capsular polysaccharide biosynthesis protein